MDEQQQLLLNSTAGTNNTKKTVKEIFCKNIWTPFLLFTFGCFTVFCAYNGSQNIASSMGGLKENGLDGNYALGILYACFALTCFVAPILVRNIGAKTCVIFQFCFLASYASSYLYPRWYTLYVSAALVGIGAGPMWVSQGMYMSALSSKYGRLIIKHGNLHNLQEDYNGLFQGYFFGIFQLTQIFGNLISGYIEHVANDKLLFLIYLGMILIGVILVCCVPTLNTFRDKGSKSIVKNVINNIERIKAHHQMENDEDDYSNNNNMTGGTFDVEKSLNTGNHDDDDDESQEGDNLLTTINILRNKKVLYILPAFFAIGMEQSIMFGDVTAYISRAWGRSNIGYIMAIFGFGDALAASIVGNLSDKYGKKIFLILASIIQLTCCGLFFYLGKATHEYPSFIILSSIAFGWGVADGIWNSVGSAVCADTFQDAKQRRGLFSAYRLLQSVGMMCFFVTADYATFMPKIYAFGGVLIVSLLGIIKFNTNK